MWLTGWGKPDKWIDKPKLEGRRKPNKKGVTLPLIHDLPDYLEGECDLCDHSRNSPILTITSSEGTIRLHTYCMSKFIRMMDATMKAHGIQRKEIKPYFHNLYWPGYWLREGEDEWT